MAQMKMVVRLYAYNQMKVINLRRSHYFFVPEEEEKNAKDKISGCYFYDYDGTCDGIRDGGIQYFHGHGRSDRKSICTRVRRTVAYGACRICA